MITRFVLVASLALFSTPALADQSSWKIELKSDGTPEPTKSNLPPHDKTAHVSKDGVNLLIACPTEQICDPANFKVFKGENDSAPIPPSSAVPGTTRTFHIDPSSAAPERVRVRWRTTTVLDEQVQAEASEAVPTLAPTSPSFRVVDFLQLSCTRGNTAGWQEMERDSGEKNTKVTVSPIGDLLSDVLQNVNEDDSVTVQVVAEPELLRFIQVVRKSAIRTTGGVAILGADVTIPAIQRHGTSCGAKTFTLRDFAAGTGTIEIQAMSSQGPLVLGKLEFPVNRLYTGMFTLGPVWSWAIEPDFGVVSNGANQVLTAREKPHQRVLWTLFYTPFVWGKRDFEMSIPLYKRLNPSLGLVLNNVTENAMLGLSFDFFNGFVATAGAHWAHVSVVDPQSGLGEGSVYTGDPSRLPTARKWVVKPFVGVTIDLRAAVQFLKAAAGAATQ
jgi:hypothetical protein